MDLVKDAVPYLECIDHTVTNEKFMLLHNTNYDLLVTSPQPQIDALHKYYESDAYISHTDAKKTLFDKVYQFVKKYSLNRKVSLINKLAPSKGSLLDIGAGTGDFLFTAKNDGWNVFGVEPNQSAKELAKTKTIDLISSTKNLKEDSFDVISMWHVLEHVSDLEFQIKELNRLVKKGGHVIIAVPNFKSFDALHYKSNWAAFDVPRHLWHFSRSAIYKLFTEKGFSHQNTLPLKFDSYYVSLLSEKYKKGKSNIFTSFYYGFLSNLKAISTKEYSSLIYVFKKA